MVVPADDRGEGVTGEGIREQGEGVETYLSISLCAQIMRIGGTRGKNRCRNNREGKCDMPLRRRRRNKEKKKSDEKRINGYLERREAR